MTGPPSNGGNQGEHDTKRLRVQQQQQQQQQQQHYHLQQQLIPSEELAPLPSPCSDVSINSHTSHTSSMHQVG